MDPHKVGGDAYGNDGTPAEAPAAEDTLQLPVPAFSVSTAHSTSDPATSTGIGRVQPGALPDGRIRTAEVITGDYLLGVNAPDGTTVEVCPPSRRPALTATAAAAEAPEPAARPTASGAVGETASLRMLSQALLERDDELERLRTLLAQGRSIRVTGAHGSGRSSLLDTVAASVADLAPAGVVRLSGYRQTAADLLQELFAATAPAALLGGHGGRPRFRPARDQLADLLREVGAIVVIDDMEFGGPSLEELLDTAPECAFLVSATPDVPAPAADSRMEDFPLAGLSREGGLQLLAERAGRPLHDTERAWGVDLWFESEGLPLRFVQAAALLRHRDAAIEAITAGLPAPEWRGPDAPEAAIEPLALAEGSDERPDEAPTLRDVRIPDGFAGGIFEEGAGPVDPAGTMPLPSLAESAAPAVRVARGLGEEAQRVLRLAVALGGEIPTAPHLPALIDADQPEQALRELVDAGLAGPVGGHYRLVDRALASLAAEWPDAEVSREAAQHFAWWTGHASVTPEQVAEEAEVLLATLRADRDSGRYASVMLLARAAAPCFGIALRWNAWERALRFGLEAARTTGAVAEEAWFHHELGVLAFCGEAMDRARAELEASVALRGALGDTRGTQTGRRVLDLLGAVSARRMLGSAVPVAPLGATPVGAGVLRRRIAGLGGGETGGHLVTRRNAAAAASGVVLAAALASVVAFGTGAHGTHGGGVSLNVGTTPSATAPGSSSSPAPIVNGPLGGTSPTVDSTSRGPGVTPTAGATGPGVFAGTSTSAGPGGTGGVLPSPTTRISPTPTPSKKPSPSPSTSPTKPTPSPTTPTPSPTPSSTATTAPAGGQVTSSSATSSGGTSSRPASTPASTPATTPASHSASGATPTASGS
jgi:hypothetical protein